MENLLLLILSFRKKRKFVLRVSCGLLLTCSCCNAAAQNIGFTYDNAGNRIKKEIVLSKSLFEEEKDEPLKEKMQRRDVVIYPNPTEGEILIQVSGSPVNGTIEIFSMNGALIERGNLSGNSCSFDLSYQPEGVYLLKISFEGETSTWKIVKE